MNERKSASERSAIASSMELVGAGSGSGTVSTAVHAGLRIKLGFLDFNIFVLRGIPKKTKRNMLGLGKMSWWKGILKKYELEPEKQVHKLTLRIHYLMNEKKTLCASSHFIFPSNNSCNCFQYGISLNEIIFKF